MNIQENWKQMVVMGSSSWLQAGSVVFLAAVPNGVLGYGFSSRCAPPALSVAGPRRCDPALRPGQAA